MMVGSIELASRLGFGSAFHVRLPLAEPAKITPLPPLEVRADRHLRLLLVEDDSIVAAVIRGLLEQEGHTVVHIVNGLAALTELAHADRSEEHTSELQSLMRNSYAVFCLKKKTTKDTQNATDNTN